jgi:XapX domain-containing protein
MTRTAIFALFTGFTVGALFGMLDIPIPAPPELAGLLGIVGIYIGYRVVTIAGFGLAG